MESATSETLVIEDRDEEDSRRGPRTRTLLRLIALLAQKEGVAVAQLSKEEIRKAFAKEEAKTRPEIAKAIAARIPAFAPKLPPVRKIWMSEDPRQSLFDAAALGVAFYGRGDMAQVTTTLVGGQLHCSARLIPSFSRRRSPK